MCRVKGGCENLFFKGRTKIRVRINTYRMVQCDSIRWKGRKHEFQVFLLKWGSVREISDIFTSFHSMYLDHLNISVG
jgi:hypothetical protein